MGLLPLLSSQNKVLTVSMCMDILRFILIFTQASYVHRLGVAILIAHWANYDYIRGREGYPAIPLNIPFPD